MNNEPIRVLHILQRMEAGGTQALLMNLYRNIDRTKIQFDFFVEYPEKQFYDDEIEKMGGRIFYNTIREDYNIKKFKKNLKRVIKENNYKIVHVHAYTIGYFALKAAKQVGVPVRIAHSHNNQAVKDKKIIFKKIMQKIYTIYATDLYACSKEAGSYLFKSKSFKVLNNSIDTEKFLFDEKKRERVRKELGISNKYVVGNVGRLHSQKNQGFLIDIFNEVQKQRKDAVLIIVGQGPLENELKEKCKKYKIEDKVLFLGVRKDVDAIYQGMDIFLLPSLFEGLGIVAVEAQAAGLPVIVSNNVADEAKVSENLIKLGLNDKNEWIEKVLSMSSDIYKRKNNRNQVLQSIIEKEYDVKAVSKKLQKWYLKKFEENT